MGLYDLYGFFIFIDSAKNVNFEFYYFEYADST